MPSNALYLNVSHDIVVAFIFDFIIVVLTITGLLRQRAARATKLWKSLYTQGITYFLATLVINFPTLVCILSLRRFRSG
jgi:hypothetical protein